MKLFGTTALGAILIAGSALATSRGSDNTTGAEAIDQPAQAESSVIENVATEDAASRGDNMITGDEATRNDLIDSDELSDVTSDDDAQRGAANDTGAELETENSDG